jgi:hypothetical protein
MGADHKDLAPRCFKRPLKTIFASSSTKGFHHRDLWRVNNDKARGCKWYQQSIGKELKRLNRPCRWISTVSDFSLVKVSVKYVERSWRIICCKSIRSAETVTIGSDLARSRSPFLSDLVNVVCCGMHDSIVRQTALCRTNGSDMRESCNKVVVTCPFCSS